MSDLPEEDNLLGHQLATDWRLVKMFGEPIVPNLPLMPQSSTPKLESSKENKLDVDTNELFDISKLLKALDEFGLRPSASQLQELQSKLTVNCNQLVRFGDFVDIVKDVFHDALMSRMHVTGNSCCLGVKSGNCTSKQTSINLELKNTELQMEIKVLKRQLKSMENACSNMENNLLTTKQELQSCINCIRKLKQQDTEIFFDGKNSMENTSKIKNSEESEANRSSLLKENAALKQEVKMLRTTNAIYKAASNKLLYFLEDLHAKLIDLLHIPKNKVGRSFSLYRNITCGGGTQGIPKRICGSVVRATSVCTPMKGNSADHSGEDASITGGKVHRQVKQVYYDILWEMTNKTKDMISVTKEMLRNEPLGTRLTEMQKTGKLPFSCSTTPSATNPLRNLPPRTVVTIMTRV